MNLEVVKRKYKYYYFLPQMFNNKDVFAGSKKAVDLAQNNINKIVKWYNKNKYFNDVSYKIEHGRLKYAHIVAKYPIDFNETLSSIRDIDRDGNYLLDGYFVASKF